MVKSQCYNRKSVEDLLTVSVTPQPDYYHTETQASALIGWTSLVTVISFLQPRHMLHENYAWILFALALGAALAARCAGTLVPARTRKAFVAITRFKSRWLFVAYYSFVLGVLTLLVPRVL